MSIRKITRLPENDKTNGWSRLLSPRTPKPALTKDIQADWVIVGGGLAGLAAARRLAENRPEDSIVVLEADQVGEGAQGRNSGFAIDSPHNVGSSMGELDAARSHVRLARTAIAYLKTQVERYGIECDWSPIGKFHAAVSEEGVRTTLKPTLQVLESLNEPHEWLDGQALHDKLGFKHFRTGIYTPGTVLLNPAGLSRGLADNMPANVTVYEKTPVLSLQQGDGVTLETPGGKVRAGKMILAVNVFAEQFGFYSGKLMPMAAHASLTRRLTENEQRELGGLASWGLTPANAFVGITMRRTNDQRILIRQHMTYAPNLRSDDESRRRVRLEHKALFDERFPNLKNVEMEHTWTGFICLSRNGSPGFGQLAPNIYSAVCQNGVGLTKGTISGMLVADMACGVDNPLIAEMQALGQPDALPPRPFLDVGVRARLAWELWRHRAEA
ncbi:MAG TPA: FAD-dependent oxidoreductase [Alcaligenes faecalis]|nr:FAD-dependent oxidoreductase [Alcaligenes faecalis]